MICDTFLIFTETRIIPLYKAEGKKLCWISEQIAHLEMTIYSDRLVENLDGLQFNYVLCMTLNGNNHDLIKHLLPKSLIWFPGIGITSESSIT